MQRKCSSIFLATEKTKARTEYFPQSWYGTVTTDCCDFTVDHQDHAYTGRLKAGWGIFFLLAAVSGLYHRSQLIIK